MNPKSSGMYDIELRNFLYPNRCYRDWREKQQEEIRARDEASKIRREETIDKAERAIEEFYENYSKKKERNIRDNKCELIYPSLLGRS